MEVGLQQIESLLYYLRSVATREIPKITRESINAYFLELELRRGVSKLWLPQSSDMSPPFLPVTSHKTTIVKSDNRYSPFEAKKRTKLRQAADILSRVRSELYYRMDVCKATNLSNI
jgi:hypothetical protein